MAITSLVDLVSTYGDEAKKHRELIELGSNRTNTSNISWTSDTSGVTYDTSTSADAHILNKGEDGLLFWLTTLFTTATPTGYGNCLLTGAYMNNLIAGVVTSELIYGVDGGATDAYAITLEVAPTAYVEGMVINFKANTPNTGACTINVNALGAKSIKDITGDDLQTGAILANQLCTVVYDGTNFVLMSGTLIPAATKIANGTNVLTLPAATDTLVGRATTDTLTNKTLTSPAINTPIITTPVIRNWDGWEDANETWTFASATTFTVAADVTGKYQKGDKIKLDNTTTKYFYIIATPTYSAPNTTITVSGGSDYALSNAGGITITANYYSKSENPQGFPDWFNWTCTATGYTASISPSFAYFKIDGTLLSAEIGSFSGTSNATTLTFNLPVAPFSSKDFSVVNTMDNTTTQTTIGHIQLTAGNTTAQIFKAWYAATFTNSGTKRAYINDILAYRI